MVFEVLKKFKIVVLILVVVFLVSGLVVNVLQALTLPLKFVNRRLYRRINTIIVYWFWCLLPFALESWAGYSLRSFGDPTAASKYMNKEHAVVLLNHRGDIDWMIGWVFLERSGMLGGTKAYMKDVAKFIPGIGWSFSLMEYPILTRDWAKDKSRLEDYCKNLADYPVNMTLCLFAEGSRYTPEKHKQSMEWAKSKRLPYLKHHLFPRTKGFSFLVTQLKNSVPAVYDITFGYAKEEPSFLGVVNAEPCTCDVLIRRIPMSEIPTDTEEEAANWLIKHYQEKDEIFDFYLKHHTFPPKYGVEFDLPMRLWPRMAFVMWTMLIGVPLVYYIITLFLSGAWWTLLIIGSVLFLADRSFQMICNFASKRSAYGLNGKEE